MEGKRKLSSTSDGDGLVSQDEDVPRKKSRNYLDSHKSIEKKRRDRINNSLSSIKELVPDCKQYGTKKLDKAEILEMSIDYLRRVQSHFAQHGGEGLATSPRDFAGEISTWILQHKQQHNDLDSFIQALLLYLSTYGSVVAQRQQQLYAPPGPTHHAADLLSPVAGNLSSMTIMSASVDPPHCVASFPPPYQGAHHQQTPQVHRPPPTSSSSQQRFASDDPQMHDLWRTQAMMQHLQQQQQQQQQQQGFHIPTSTDHDPPPLVQPPDGLSAHQDVTKAASTQPLHHLLMQQQPGSHQGGNYPQMIVLQQQQQQQQQQASTRPLHHPATTTPSDEANQQIQQFLDACTKGGSGTVNVQSRQSGGSGDVQMINAQDIVHHQIQQQMRMANPQQGSQPLAKHTTPTTQAKTPLPGTETLVMGMAPTAAAAAPATTAPTSLTEELLDSGTSVPAQPETADVADIAESESWGATQVAMETTVDSEWKVEVSGGGGDGAEKLKVEDESESDKGKDKQSASTLLLLANGEKKEDAEEEEEEEEAKEKKGDETPSPAAAVAADDDLASEQ